MDDNFVMAEKWGQKSLTWKIAWQKYSAWHSNPDISLRLLEKDKEEPELQLLWGDKIVATTDILHENGRILDYNLIKALDAYIRSKKVYDKKKKEESKKCSYCGKLK